MDCKRTPGLISVCEGRLPDGSDTCLPALPRNATGDASVLPITGWEGGGSSGGWELKGSAVDHLVRLGSSWDA